jgi:alpha-tubulin suppressor-like RCC1 family protein
MVLLWRGLRLLASRACGLMLVGSAITVVFAVQLAGTARASQVLAWGENSLGELGDGTVESSVTPRPVSGLSEVTAISAHGGSGGALVNGSAMTWGLNEPGNLGDGVFPGPESCIPEPESEYHEEDSCSKIPVSVSGLSEAKALSLGSYHSAAALADGGVMTWGNNTVGQLGDGTETGPELCPSGSESKPCSRSPVEVSGVSGAVAVANGFEYTLALLSDGKVMAWGENGVGELGDGERGGGSDVPVEVKKLSGVVAIAAGAEFNLALLSDGKVMAWGYNESGQLGDGTHKLFSDVPVEVKGLSEVVAIAAGPENGLALLSDGKVMAWGEPEYDQVGCAERSRVPVEVCGLSEVTAIAAGGSDNLALLKDGNVMSWGYIEGFGETPLPAGVCGLNGIIQIASGSGFNLAYHPGGESSSPLITGLSPNAGAQAGGGKVMISGRNLGEVQSISFGSNAAERFKVKSASSIEAVYPEGKSGLATVSVTSPTGTGLCSFHYEPLPPVVEKIQPTSGPVSGGTKVRIFGREFQTRSDVSVMFGSVKVFPEITEGRPNELIAEAPPEPAGRVDVTVTTPAGTSQKSAADQFTYRPVVESVSPGSGPAAGGTSVTIKGAGFAVGTSATKLTFGRRDATSVDCTSTTQCTVVSPAQAAGVVGVKATVNEITSPKNAPADEFTYE